MRRIAFEGVCNTQCVFKDGGWIKQMVEILTPRIIIFPNLPGTLSCTTGAISLLAILKIVKKMSVLWWCPHYDLFPLGI